MLTEIFIPMVNCKQLPAFLKPFVFMLLWTVMALICVLPAKGAGQILILYDSAGPYDQIGKEHAILMTNLLGHFDLPVDAKPVCQYTLGEIHDQAATFYVGATFEERNYYDPESVQWQNYNDFLADAATAEVPLIWLNHNLSQLQQRMNESQAQSFSNKFGFAPAGLLNNLYNRVFYKETELYKGVVPFANPGADLTGCIEEGDGKYACSTQLNTLTILDAEKTEVYAWAGSTLMQVPQTPYITRSGNFWFLGDLPLEYLSEEDRYLAFADILHDMLGIEHTEEHRALVRLEDVSAMTSVQDLAAIDEYLSRESIPFSIATIAQYRNNLMPGQPLWLSEAGDYLKCLHRNGRASIVAHGYTHQRDRLDNPYNGISGDDFEFYRVTLNPDNSLNFIAPLRPDTKRQNRERLRRALHDLRLTGLDPFCWEAPHYLASENGYLGILPLFPIHYGRMTYFNHVGGRPRIIGSGKSPRCPYWGTQPRMLGQFFPYLIYKDVYGYAVIPENIGNIEPDPFEGYRPLYPEDLIRHAQKALVVRDGFASFFYHPDLGVDYLRQVVEGLKDLGYTFVAADSLIP